MLRPDYLAEKFDAAETYADHIAAGTTDHQQKWRAEDDLTRLTPEQQKLLAGFTREMRVLVLSGTWCGDCVAQCPLLAKLGEANPRKVLVRFLDRDTHKDLAEQVTICGGMRVPTAIFLTEDHQFCSILGDRTLRRYRTLAEKKLGAACETGLVPAADAERAATLQDWAEEFERVQLMLRLSPRLREKHGD